MAAPFAFLPVRAAATASVGILVVFCSLTLRQSAHPRRADGLLGRVRPDESFASLDRQLKQA